MALRKFEFRTILTCVLICTAVLTAVNCMNDEDEVNGTTKVNETINEETAIKIKEPIEDEDDDDFGFSIFDEPSGTKKPDTSTKLADSISRAVRDFVTDEKRKNNFNLASLFSGGNIGNAFGLRSLSTRSLPDAEELPTVVDPDSPESFFENFKTDSEKDEKVTTFGDNDEEPLNFDDFLGSDETAGKPDANNATADHSEDAVDFDLFLPEDKQSNSTVSNKTDDSVQITENKAVFNQLNADLKNTKSVFGFPLNLNVDEGVLETKGTNINKIPKKVEILSRQTKSLDESTVISNLDGANSNMLNVEAVDEDSILSGLYTKNIGVENVLSVYSTQRLIDNWREIKKALSPTCKKHLGEYLVGLVKHKMWALKMDDASGRYTTGYFWGNGYWSGSAALCNKVAEDRNNGENKDSTRVSRNDGLTHFETYQRDNNMASDQELAPFSPAFYMAKLQLNNNASIGGPNVVQLGLCFPMNCSADDVQMALELSNAPATQMVLYVKAPIWDRYDMFQDRTFQILAGVSIVVLALIIAGTLYEMALGSRLQVSKNTATPRHQKLEGPAAATMPTVKMSNGKSIYSLNGGTNNNNNSEERLNIDMPIQEPVQLNIFSELILSFSVISNMRSICDQSVGSDTIPTIHGLRSISMMWVILGHTCIVAFKYSDNTELRKIVEKEFLFQTVTNGAFSVDTFFCISGILVSYLYFRTNAKGSLDRLTQGTRGITSGVLQFIGLLAYRFARLTAPYMFMLGVVEVSMKWFHHNSVFDPPTQDHINCPEYWWRNILYINTLFPVEQMCMLWSWYLADDSQFYVIGAIILILAASHFKTAAVALGVFLVSSWGTTGYIAWSNNHMPSTDDPLALFDKIYDKPWTRLGPYLIGMATGWLLFKTNCKIRMTKLAVFSGWVTSFTILICLVYGLYNTELSPITSAAYSSLSHTAWGIAISWIVIACSTGYGGYINSFLSATFLYPFSRVTYCAYLVHPVVMRYLAMHLDHPIHIGKDIVTIIFLGQMVASYIISFIISLAFEAPVVTMLKIVAPNRRKKLV